MKLSLLSYNRSEFLRVFPPKFKDKLKESIIPFKEKLIAKNIANGLYRDLADFKYHPSPPRDYIVFNKHNYVSRIVTSFHAKDYFLTYFCCKMLEEEIAKIEFQGLTADGDLVIKLEYGKKRKIFFSIMKILFPLIAIILTCGEKTGKIFKRKHINSASQANTLSFLNLILQISIMILISISYIKNFSLPHLNKKCSTLNYYFIF
jgi:hypothetical protein